ncbi:MAG: hypothetical protein HLX50_01845 [Alteromonadaceae bacterium]|nr:hypothetical protein [Alteromonadaceae bacterium]
MATYDSGSGSDTLTFTYTVQDGDTLAINNRMYVTANPLSDEPDTELQKAMLGPSYYQVDQLIVDSAVLSQLETVSDGSHRGRLMSEKANFNLSSVKVEGHTNTLRTNQTELNLSNVWSLENISTITTTNSNGTVFTGFESRGETFVGGAGADTFANMDMLARTSATKVKNPGDTFTGARTHVIPPQSFQQCPSSLSLPSTSLTRTSSTIL